MISFRAGRGRRFGKSFVVLLDPAQIVKIVDHDAVALGFAPCALIGFGVDIIQRGAVAKVKARHRIQGMAINRFALCQLTRGKLQQSLGLIGRHPFDAKPHGKTRQWRKGDDGGQMRHLLTQRGHELAVAVAWPDGPVFGRASRHHGRADVGGQPCGRNRPAPARSGSGRTVP